MARHAARVVLTGAQRISMGRYDGKRQLGRTRRRCEDDIKMDL
jgi:hypothetical protein